jgi:hypothetical protein
MRERQEGHGVHDEDASTMAPVSAGKRTLIAARYPALTGRMARRDGGGAEPSIHDAATIAVENKDAGSVVDSGVALRVGAHLGVDFSGVRVHQDGLAQEATQAKEVDVRVQSEEFAIRHHLPETRPGYRNPDSTVNRQNIHDSVYNSSHYNPSVRHRINRQYEGDAPTTGWYVPPP